MKKSIYSFAFLVIIILASCGTFKDVSIEKRHYRKGYYVHVRDDRSTEKNSASAADIPADEKALTEKNTVENSGTTVENSAQRTAQITRENPGLKKYFEHLSAARPFKKGGAVFHERVKNAVASHKPAQPARDDDDRVVALFLLIILAIILPPLAVLLADGVGVNFLIDLLLWLLGFGFVIFVSGIGFVYVGIFGLLAIIYALLVIFDAI